MTSETLRPVRTPTSGETVTQDDVCVAKNRFFQTKLHLGKIGKLGKISASSRRCRGMFQIVRFNWPFYALAAGGIVGVALLLWFAKPSTIIAIPLVFGAALGLWWAAASLVASHWVYDRSGLTEWRWLSSLFRTPPRCWVNIHAGFDETSRVLTELFPLEQPAILDIYEPRITRERSIVRARRSAARAPVCRPCAAVALPLRDSSCHAVFLLLAIHEIRDPASRTAVFRELHRALSPGGRVVLVEHLRDAANFAAYGPGVLHFLPRKEWLRLGCETGFALEREERFTPFVRWFVWRK